MGEKKASVLPALLSGGGVFGAAVPAGMIWRLSDLFNGLMAVPNLICLLLLQRVIVKETDHYLWGGGLDEREDFVYNTREKSDDGEK